MSEVKPSLLDDAAQQYLRAQAAAADAEAAVARYRRELIEIVQQYGQHPPRATKTLALMGNEYELRVTTPVEVTVDTRAALRIERACRAQSPNWRSLFARLFRTVKTFVLMDGAQELLDRPKLPVRAPRNLRALFARALKVRDLAPQLEVRKKDKEAA